MDRTELAWAAGFWDGEGSAYLTGGRDRVTKQPQARINQASTTGMPEVLVRFREGIGLGAIQGPDLVKGREPLYRWVVSSRRDVAELLSLISPWLGGVKRHQLETALGIAPTSPVAWEEWSSEERHAWAAGLWDGEGCICLLKHRSHIGHFVPEAAITQSSESGRPEVLTRFADMAGGGHWYGPFDQEDSNLPVYRWKLFRLDEIKAVFELVWPWLGVVKRDQATRVFDVLASQPLLPRGNPAWGSHKTHCLRGHEYVSTRIRPFRGRGKNLAPRRASKQCLACVREDARAKRFARKMQNGGLRRRS